MLLRNGDIRLRACLRCRGDTYLERSDYPEWRCLQCGGRVSDVFLASPMRSEVSGSLTHENRYDYPYGTKHSARTHPGARADPEAVTKR